jgi:Spy/CpxP family protein refolding chaperone
MPGVTSRIDVTQSEKEALDKLFIQNRRSILDLRDDLEQEKLKLDDIMDQKNFNERAALDQYRKIEKKREKLAMERFRYLLEVRKLLGQDRYRDLMTSAREYHGRGSDRGMPRRGR